MIISIAICILQIVALWKVFEKAGEAGWKSIIPIYNLYILFKITKSKNFGFYLGALIVGSIMVSVGAFFSTYMAFGAMEPSIWVTVLDIAGIVFMFASIVIQIQMLNRLSHCFNHGTGFTVLLVFLPIIAYCIMAFSSDQFTFVDEDGENIVNDISEKKTIATVAETPQDEEPTVEEADPDVSTETDIDVDTDVEE